MSSSRNLIRWTVSAFASITLLGGMNAVARGESSPAMRAAQQALDNLRAESVNVAAQLHTAQQVNQQAKEDLETTKRSVSDRIKSSAEYQTVRQQVEDLQAKHAEAHQQALTNLRGDKEYEAAQKAHERAKAQQRERSGSSATDDSRKAAAKSVLETKNAIKLLEELAVLKLPGARESEEQLRASQKELAELNHKIQLETERDPEVDSAKRSSADSFRKYQTARMNVDRLKTAIAQQIQFVKRLGDEERAQEARQKDADRRKSKRQEEERDRLKPTVIIRRMQ